MFDLCSRAIKHNGWSSIELLPYAITGKEGEGAFKADTDSPMASKLVSSNEVAENLIINVSTKKLSGYLDDSIDFLKMDIEGCEGGAIVEAGEALRTVKQGFIEFHYSPHNDMNSLSRILSELERLAFDYRIQQQPKEMMEVFVRKPLERVPANWSCNIFFKCA
jgi:FkbM family methyltransferase